MAVDDNLLVVLAPTLRYTAYWFAAYYIVSAICKATLPWFRVLKPAQTEYYSKKLKLGKRGLSKDAADAEALQYFQFFFVTSVLSTAHGFVIAFLLVPFAWTQGWEFLSTATLASTASDPVVLTACHVFTGYILNDFLWVLPQAVRYKVMDDLLFLAHHVSLTFTWISFMTGSWGHLFAVPTMLTELTAPCVFFRWLLSEFRMSSSPLFLLNGIALLVGWWFLRIFGYTLFLSWRLVELREEVLAPDHVLRNLVVLVFHLLGCFLQLNWGYLLTWNAIKVLRGSNDSKKKKEKKSD